MLQQNIKRKQAGASFISMLAFLLLLGFSLNFIVRIFGMHWDDRILVSVLEDLPQVIDRDTSEKDVRKLLDSRLDINRLRMISTKELIIKKNRGVITLIWQYERREHVMSNVDIALTFSHEYNY
jgi:hypothetical protein